MEEEVIKTLLGYKERLGHIRRQDPSGRGRWSVPENRPSSQCTPSLSSLFACFLSLRRLLLSLSRSLLSAPNACKFASWLKDFAKCGYHYESPAVTQAIEPYSVLELELAHSLFSLSVQVTEAEVPRRLSFTRPKDCLSSVKPNPVHLRAFSHV